LADLRDECTKRDINFTGKRKAELIDVLRSSEEMDCYDDGSEDEDSSNEEDEDYGMDDDESVDESAAEDKSVGAPDLGDSITDDSFHSDVSSVEYKDLDFSKMKVTELRNECTKRDINFTVMKKAELIDVLTQQGDRLVL